MKKYEINFAYVVSLNYYLKVLNFLYQLKYCNRVENDSVKMKAICNGAVDINSIQVLS